MTAITKRNGTGRMDTMFEELIDDIFTPYIKSNEKRRRYMDTNYVEATDDEMIIHINAIGHNPDDIKIKFKGDNLSVISDVEVDNPFINKKLGHSFKIPEVYDGSSTEASFNHGVLTLTIPIKEAEDEDETVIKIN